MKDFMQELKLNFILTALFCIVCGVVLFVWPDVSARIVCMVLGAILVLMGAVYLVSFFSSPAGSFMKQIYLLLTICFVAIGVWILLKPEFVIRLIPVIVGIIIILHGIYDLQQAVYLCRAKYSFWWLALLFAVLTVAFGGVLIWNPFEAMNIAVKFIGVFLVFDGVSDLWIFSRARRVTKIIRDAVENGMDGSLYGDDDIID